MEITAENSDYAENADEEGLRCKAAQSIAFTQWVRGSGFRVCHPNLSSSTSYAFSASSVVIPIAVSRIMIHSEMFMTALPSRPIWPI